MDKVNLQTQCNIDLNSFQIKLNIDLRMLFAIFNIIRILI